MYDRWCPAYSENFYDQIESELLNLKSADRLYHENVLGLKYPDDVPACVTLYPNDSLLTTQSKSNKRLDTY